MSRSPRRRLARIEPSLEEVLESLPSSRNYKREILEEQIKSGGQKINRTRGWRASSPQRGIERHELKDKCGDACFLDPENEKFPVCSSLRATGGKCGYDCRGIESAI